MITLQHTHILLQVVYPELMSYVHMSPFKKWMRLQDTLAHTFSLTAPRRKLFLTQLDIMLDGLCPYASTLCPPPQTALGSSVDHKNHQCLIQTWFKWGLELPSCWYWDGILEHIYCARINHLPLPNGCGQVQLVWGPGRQGGRRRVRSGIYSLFSLAAGPTGWQCPCSLVLSGSIWLAGDPLPTALSRSVCSLTLPCSLSLAHTSINPLFSVALWVCCLLLVDQNTYWLLRLMASIHQLE